MELNLKLRIVQGNSLPINYQYELSSWIYSVLRAADNTHSEFLHNHGYRVEGRGFKLFTFSQMDVRPYVLHGDSIRLLGQSISIIVRFLVNTSLENFIKGLFLNQNFFLGNKSDGVCLNVAEIQTLPPPDFKPLMRYSCLSPICISVMRADKTAEYLSPESNQFGECLTANLMRKGIAHPEFANSKGTETIDRQVLPSFKFSLLNKPRKKGIHVKANTAQHTQLIGYLFHFELLAPPELHEIGYYAGFGEKNSMGFGCVKNL